MAENPIHIASSKSWGIESGARLCELIVSANTAIEQDIKSNRTDLMDLLTLEQLNEPDDLGLTLPFLAVYYDRPEMLKYLNLRGVDLNKYCDPMGFGTPMYYAVTLGRVNLIKVLNNLGNRADSPCDLFNQLPLLHAKRINDKQIIDMVIYCTSLMKRAQELLLKHTLRILYRKKYLLKVRKCIPLINRIGRGYIGREKVKAIRAHIKSQAKLKAERNQRRAERKAQGLEYDDSDLDTVTMQDEEDDVDDDGSQISNDDSLHSQPKNKEVTSKTGRK